MKNSWLSQLAATLLALTLLLGMCASVRAEEEVITAREMTALLDGFVENMGPEHLDEWRALFPAARESDAPLTRADGIFMLYVAACTARPEKIALGNNWLPLHEKIGEKIWDEYTLNEELFGEIIYNPSPWHEWNYGPSAYFFALDLRDWDGEMLFDYDPEANTLHTDALLTRTDAEKAIARLTASWSPLEDSITAREMMAMLDDFFEAVAPEKLGEWQALFPAARESDEMLLRSDGIYALYYAACTVRPEQVSIGDNWIQLNQAGDIWSGYDVNHALFGSVIDQATPWHWHEWSCGAAALFFSLDFRNWRGDMLFEYDTETKSLLAGEPLTQEDAQRAVNMLTQALSPARERAEDEEYLAQVEAKKQEILNSASEYEATGHIYYIANDGDDNNNGRSAKYPWKTLERSTQEGLQPGDVVLLKRGDLWREILRCVRGVTYSAYGEGEKPRIYGSPENGAGVEKWTLYYDQDGVKIWRFHHELYDCGGIVFNEGESYALRVFSCWDGEKAVVMNQTEKPFDMIEQLDQNHHFYLDYAPFAEGKKVPLDDTWQLNGSIYLRHDEGNPGEMYESIEFISSPYQYGGIGAGLAETAGDNVLDNLCLKYSVMPGVFGFYPNSRENIIQNSEVAWIGGSTLRLDIHNWAAGEGIRLLGNSAAVHNYVYQCFDGGINVEPDLGDTLNGTQFENIRIEDNVIEYCNSGFFLSGISWESETTDGVLRNIAIRSNDVLYSGYGWSGDPDYDFGWKHPTVVGNAVLLGYHDYPVENYVFESNTFYKAKHAMVLLPEFSKEKPLFTGNRYLQNDNGIAVALMQYEETYDAIARSEDEEELKEIYTRYLGDTQAEPD